ncbi:MAG: penicillin-binding transpeptidase domain-containing protein [bacterium]|nr:penicillin-binding transpeptidase domain-containing protein [bacterium]
MKSGERLRLGFVYGLLGLVPVFLLGWLGYVQVAQAGELDRKGRAPLRLVAATAARQGAVVERTPAPRGSIVDRNGQPLAFDRPVYEVRAWIGLSKKRRASTVAMREWLDGLARDFAVALASDPELADRGVARRKHEERLRKLITREFGMQRLPAGDRALPEGFPRSAELRLAGEVDVLPVIDALRAIGKRRDLRGFVRLDFLPAFARSYPDRHLTYGIVGHTVTEWARQSSGGRELVTFGTVGLEAANVLSRGVGHERPGRRDGDGRPYFLAPPMLDPARPVLHGTLDLELQRIATDELATQAEAGAKVGKVTVPKWGALVLVEVASGDVVAAASWHRDVDNYKSASFTPYQSLFEPGSIIKPLVCAYALEAGVLDWGHVYDCRPHGSDYRDTIRGLGRRKPVRDDHPCQDLNAHGILVNSSNIGMSLIGLGLAREQWRDYMRFYGFGEGLDLPLPHGRVGGWPRQSFDPSTRLKSFRANSAISFSFGYEFQVTAFHIARAYLRMMRGQDAELRVCRGVELDGKWLPAPRLREGGKLSPRVLAAVRDAMADVMSPAEGATGRHAHRLIAREYGIDIHGLVAGKTGTAASMVGIPGRGRVSVRNASFVGFLPAHAPRWLAVCVLQKDDSARFYGGSYAAPPAVRLLLQAERLAAERRRRQESRVAGGQTR